MQELLRAEDRKARPGWETIRRNIEIKGRAQSVQRIAEAHGEFQYLEQARELALRAYGSPDLLVYGIAAALVTYLACILFLQQPIAGLAPEITGVLAASLGLRWRVWRRRRADVMQAVPDADGKWQEALRNGALEPFIKLEINEQDGRLFNPWIDDDAPPELAQGPEPKRLVVTDAMEQVNETARNVHSGSVGICGPRGSGKSTILQFFGQGSGDGRDTRADGDIRLVLPAPVDYEPREFIIHLYRQLCAAVPHGRSDRSAIAVETRRHLDELKYLRTYTTRVSATLTPRSVLGLTGERAVDRAEQPFTLPDLVTSFRDYSAQVAAWRQSVSPTARLVIGIDEVDKIRDGDRAEGFLNDIKAIFGVPGCLYIVSLSEDALAVFARRAPGIRSALDSAFDELVPIGPMTYRSSEQLLFKRITGVPRPFLALCHVLAGGMPRDLVRAARALIDVARHLDEKTLPEMTGALVGRELESLRQASIRRLAENAGPGALLAELYDRQWPGQKLGELNDAAQRMAAAARAADTGACAQTCQELATALSFAVTVTQVFGPHQDDLLTCLRACEHGIVDDLAAARHAMRVNLGLTDVLLQQYRQRHGIGDPDAS